MKHRNFFLRQASQLGLAEDLRWGNTVGSADFYTYVPGSQNRHGPLGSRRRLPRPCQDLGSFRQSEKGAQLKKSDRAVVVSNDFCLVQGRSSREYGGESQPDYSNFGFRN
jgi:hypothetical protein